MTIKSSIKRFLPRSLLGRSLLIIVTPLVIMQLVSAFVFYETHWNKVAKRMARALAGDVAIVMDMLDRYPEPSDWTWIFTTAHQRMEFWISYDRDGVLPNQPRSSGDSLEMRLVRELDKKISGPYVVDARSLTKDVSISVQLASGVIKIVVTRKRLFSSTTYVFIIWMVGTSLLLLGVATIFMRNQVRPIRKLAVAADDFGKGRDSAGFKPEGAREVRLAAAAFLAMRARIVRHITQRTDMLAGVSHDLRTPLTRMKLQLAMFNDNDPDGVRELLQDISEMEYMLEEYLAFARGEGTEAAIPTDLNALLEETVAQVKRKGSDIQLSAESNLSLPLKPNGFRRCLGNLIDNATRYGEHVSVWAGHHGDSIQVIVDDDGPGVPEENREEVFKPFFRLDGSRNPGTGGVGLGLSIARDVARGHGGDIELDRSPRGGLRARLTLPL